MRLSNVQLDKSRFYISSNLIVVVFVITTVILGWLLSSTFVSADSVVDTINITVSVSCTMSGTGVDTHNTEIANGTYEDEIGTTTLRVFCNDSNGFAIYAAGYTGNEIGKTNSNKLVGTAASGSAVIETGTATSTSNPDVSNWAMKLGTVTTPAPTYPIIISGSATDTEKETGDPDFSDYTEVPNEYVKVAYRNGGTDIGQSAEGAILTTTYGVYISKNQPADIYTGQVKYTLVHPSDTDAPFNPISCEPDKICYRPNASTVEGTMGNQPTSDSVETTLWASNFKRDGYGFAGWSDAYDYNTNANANFYGPMETIVTPSDVSVNGFNLYAVWIASAGNLQGWTGCSAMQVGNVTALTDTRDNNTYAIAKLADGNCWMIENLRLANKDSNNSDIILSSTNTNNPSLPLTNVYATYTRSNHLSPSIDPAQTEWCEDQSNDCIDQSMLATNNTVMFTNNTASNYSASSNVYSYGNYYNWYSATAGHGTYSKTNGNVTGDICPTGWHLPIGSTSGDFYGLNTDANSGSTTDSAGLRAYPNNFIYAGTAYYETVGLRSTNGCYWSSTASFDSGAFSLDFGSNKVNPGRNYNAFKFEGKTVRCLTAN